MIGDSKPGFTNRDNKADDGMRTEKIIVYVGITILIILVIVAIIITVIYAGNYARTNG